jgi:outer membrane protein W
MQSFSKTLVVVLLSFALFPTSSRAQFQLNVTGGRLIPTDRGTSINDGLWGPGATFRYFINPNVAIGLNTRYFTRNDSYQYGNVSASNRGSALSGAGQVEYFFTTKSALQPYVGAEIGVYHNWYKTEYIAGGTPISSRGNDSNLLLGPKAGLQYAITPTAGLSLDASYQFLVGRGYTGHALFVNAGGFLKFGGR